MKEYLSEEFKQYYLNIAKPVIEKCAEVCLLMRKIQDTDNYNLPDDHPDIVKIESSKDQITSWLIWKMMLRIDTALQLGYNSSVLKSLDEIYERLDENSEYWKNIWNSDYSSEEAKNLKECWVVVDELRKKLS